MSWLLILSYFFSAVSIAIGLLSAYVTRGAYNDLIKEKEIVRNTIINIYNASVSCDLSKEEMLEIMKSIFNKYDTDLLIKNIPDLKS